MVVIVAVTPDLVTDVAPVSVPGVNVTSVAHACPANAAHITATSIMARSLIELSSFCFIVVVFKSD